MEPQTKGTTRLLTAFCGIAALAPCIFFGWYSARLLYVNLTMTSEEAATHRTSGMLVGAVAFPLATLIFGLIAWLCLRSAARKK